METCKLIPRTDHDNESLPKRANSEKLQPFRYQFRYHYFGESDDFGMKFDNVERVLQVFNSIFKKIRSYRSI